MYLMLNCNSKPVVVVVDDDGGKLAVLPIFESVSSGIEKANYT